LNDGRGWNSLLIDGRILLDLSPSAITQIHRLGIDPRTIEVIFISHLHADHLFGIPFLFLEYRIRYERSSPLHIVGPAGLPERIESLCTLAWPELDRGGLGTRIEPVYTIVREEGEVHRNPNGTLRPFRLRVSLHPQGEDLRLHR